MLSTEELAKLYGLTPSEAKGRFPDIDFVVSTVNGDCILENDPYEQPTIEVNVSTFYLAVKTNEHNPLGVDLEHRSTIVFVSIVPVCHRLLCF